MSSNSILAKKVLERLAYFGVKEVCICPGARNAPWVVALSENPDFFRVHSHFEERCASFFALGRIRRTRSPVAVITTSGTAVGELLPATMEASYSGAPLVLLTADRPRRYRGTGSPQVAEQVGLFGKYVSHEVDLEGSEEVDFQLSLNFPTHINVCFDEPLIDENAPIRLTPLSSRFAESQSGRAEDEGPAGKDSCAKLDEFFKRVQSPLILVGMLNEEDREKVLPLLIQMGRPTYFEGLSGLREDLRCAAFRIHRAEGMMDRSRRADTPFDGVIRIGRVPTHRFWRDLESLYLNLPVLSVSELPYSGLARPSCLIQGSIPFWLEKLVHSFQKASVQAPFFNLNRWQELDQEANQKVQRALLQEPRSEPGIIAALSAKIPFGSSVFLGNSLPIREWDLAAVREPRDFDLWASRGLNGIDGQLSAFFGFAEPSRENWAILGDLTTLYDLSAPWVLSQRAQLKVNIVVLNNSGGQIFSRMFRQKEFLNQHEMIFKGWADLWNLDYELWNEVPASLSHSQKSRVIELCPSEEATQRFWKSLA